MNAVLTQTLRLPCGALLPNRIAKAAMSERLACPAAGPSVGHVALYQRWAEGGAGLLITGNVMVDPAALGEDGNVVVEDDRHAAALARWATAARTGGTLAIVQLNHPGRQSPRNLSRAPVAPSAVAVEGMFGAFARPRALSGEEIAALVGRFARAAAVVVAAGFDGVQIHAAHGYLISQFLSPRCNLRDDDWGGDAVRRRRFLLEVVAATRAALPAHAILSVKLNSADFQRGGFDEAESMAVVDALATAGVDLLEVSGGTYEAAVMFGDAPPGRASTRAREAFFLDYAEKVRQRVALPLMLTGGFRTGEGMAAALEGGAVDVVGLARPLCVEPELPARLLTDPLARAQTVDLSGGPKAMQSLVQGTWYQRQIDRMARGAAPDPTLGRLRAIAGYLGGRAPFAAAAPA